MMRHGENTFESPGCRYIQDFSLEQMKQKCPDTEKKEKQ